jgi:hypothetical protein
MKIAVHPLTADPTAAWRELSQTQKVVKITAKLPTTEAASDKVRPLDLSIVPNFPCEKTRLR